jgi:prolyl-tRNA synthetase
MAAIVETHHDDNGIIWPDNVSPYDAYLVVIGEAENVRHAADQLYEALTAAGVLVLYDERADIRAGEKFADADLTGIPYRIVVSEKTFGSGQFEVKKRGDAEAQLLSQEDVLKIVSGSR